MIPLDLKVKIRRLFYAEHHTINAIAEGAGVHRDTVRAAIEADRFVRPERLRPRPVIESFMPLVEQTLKDVPNVRATRLVEILRDRGYKGSVSALREVLREIRGRRAAKRYQRLVLFPGEQAQCDWASFGTMQVGRAKRRLSCFVMVFSYSRWSWARFTLDQTFESFLRGHMAAFRAAGGVPRTVLYDNLKSAVIDRYGDAVRFNEGLLEMAGHYHFRPQVCHPRRGNEKGRVERAIGYLRTSFFPARHFRNLDDANRQLTEWLERTANRRSWPQDRTRSVSDAFAEEREKLMALPEHDLPAWHSRPVRSDKTGYVRFDLNDYSLPPDVCRKPLTLMASDRELLVRDGEREVARHERSYDSGVRIDDASHLHAAHEARQASLPPRRRDTLVALIPDAAKLLEMLVQRDENLHPHLRRIYDLIEIHGQVSVASAIAEAIQRGTPRSESVGQIIERRERAKRTLPLVPVDLPDRPGVRDIVVRPHDLSRYDQPSVVGKEEVGDE